MRYSVLGFRSDIRIELQAPVIIHSNRLLLYSSRLRHKMYVSLNVMSQIFANIYKPLDMNAYLKIVFLTCQPRHMLWVLKIIV